MIDEQLRDYEALKPWTFLFLDAFSLERDLDGAHDSPYRLRIRLAQAVDDNTERLEVEFVGVRGLKCGELDRPFNSHLQILDVSQDQLDGISFRVVEEENEMFSFWCSNFRIVDSEP
ncbi:MAG: hypothetical protein ACI9OJ_000246 [Myxococcota bacterium]|jgi:hypothetical protein